MADQILHFHPRENLLQFPTLPRERKNLELHRTLDKLVEAGCEEAIWSHFEILLAGFSKPALVPEVSPPARPEEKHPRREPTPEELELQANPLAFLPKVSGLIDAELYQKWENLIDVLRNMTNRRFPCLNGLKFSTRAWTLEITDLYTNIKRFYTSSEREDYLQIYSAEVCACNVNRLVTGGFKPEHIAEAVEEIEVQLAYVPKRAMLGGERAVVTRFREWQGKAIWRK